MFPINDLRIVALDIQRTTHDNSLEVYSTIRHLRILLDMGRMEERTSRLASKSPGPAGAGLDKPY